MPQTVFRSHRVLPVRVSWPSCCKRRQTAPMLRRDPAENLAHDGSLLLANLVARRTATGMTVDVEVAVGSPRQNIDDPMSSGMAFAAPAAFTDLGAFVLGHHALDLKQ